MRDLVPLAVAALCSLTTASVLHVSTPASSDTCALQEPLRSCAVTGEVNSCCVETKGGLVVNTQYWQTETGREDAGQKLPADSWTIHGLWPDFCDGTWDQYCDLSRQYDPRPNGDVPPYKGPQIGTFLEKLGKQDLIEYMDKYWVSSYDENWVLWAHEFSKHATCFSTFDVKCYGSQYKMHEDVVDYFETSIAFFQKLPTWQWLADKSIRPCNTTTYTLSDLEAALTERYGARPYIGCSGDDKTVVSEVWYFSNVLGRSQRIESVPVDAKTESNCAKAPGALQYPERNPRSL